jgi:hypothetical protein
VVLPDGHFPLLHRLQQGRLGLGRRAVDFVRQQNIRKNRPLDKAKLAPPVLVFLQTFVPVMSEGIRSGVNWIRLKPTSRIRASVLTMSVLARPGTPSSRQCPRVKMAANNLLDHLVLADDDLSAAPAASLGGAG